MAQPDRTATRGPMMVGTIVRRACAGAQPCLALEVIVPSPRLVLVVVTAPRQSCHNTAALQLRPRTRQSYRAAAPHRADDWEYACELGTGRPSSPCRCRAGVRSRSGRRGPEISAPPSAVRVGRQGSRRVKREEGVPRTTARVERRHTFQHLGARVSGIYMVSAYLIQRC